MATFKKAKANKIPAAFSKAQPDKLFVRGSCGQKEKTKNSRNVVLFLSLCSTPWLNLV